MISNINAWVHYSNGDTYLVSRMVEKVYGKKFTQLCYEKIFTPLEIGFPIGFHVVWIKERHLNMFIGVCICSCFRDWVLKGFFIKLLKKPCKKTKNR